MISGVKVCRDKIVKNPIHIIRMICIGFFGYFIPKKNTNNKSE